MDTVASFCNEQGGSVTVAIVLSVLCVVCVIKWYEVCMPGVRAVHMEAILPTCRNGGKSISSVLLVVGTSVNTAS